MIPRRLIEEAVPEGPAGRTDGRLRADAHGVLRGERPRPGHVAADAGDARAPRPGVGASTIPTVAALMPQGDVVSGYRDFREYIAALDDDGLLRRVKSLHLQGHRADAAGAPAVPRPARRAAHRVPLRAGDRRDRPAVPRAGRGGRPGRQPRGLRQGPRLRARRHRRALGRGAQRRLHRARARRRRSRASRRSTSATTSSSTTASSSSRTPSRRPGFDPAPYFTSPFWVTKDPGDRRAQRRHLPRDGQGAGARRDDGPPVASTSASTCRARASGARCSRRPSSSAARPAVGLCSVAKMPYGVDEFAVAGAIAGEPIELVKCQHRRPRGAGHAPRSSSRATSTRPSARTRPRSASTRATWATRVANPVFNVTGDHAPRRRRSTRRSSASSRRRRAASSASSPTTPSTSSTCARPNIPGVLDVQLHEATGSYGLMVIQLKKMHPSQPWQALHCGGGPRPDHRQDDRGGRRRHRSERRRFGQLGHGLSHAARTSTCTSSRARRRSSTRPRRRPRRTSTSSASRRRWAPRRSSSTPPASGTTRPPRCRARSSWRRPCAAGRRKGCRRLSLKKPWFGYELGYWTDEAREEAKAASTAATSTPAPDCDRHARRCRVRVRGQ